MAIETVSIGKYGGTITASATSEPSPPSISVSTTESWATVNGTTISLGPNTGGTRTCTLTVTATTPESGSYQGTATASSAWTISQSGYNISYSLSIIADTQGMEDGKYIDVALSSSNSTNDIYETNGHPDHVVESSFVRTYSIQNPSIYVFVRISDGCGSANITTTSTNSMFNHSNMSVGEGTWVLIGGGSVSLSSSSQLTITITYTEN